MICLANQSQESSLGQSSPLGMMAVAEVTGPDLPEDELGTCVELWLTSFILLSLLTGAGEAGFSEIENKC